MTDIVDQAQEQNPNQPNRYPALNPLQQSRVEALQAARHQLRSGD